MNPLDQFVTAFRSSYSSLAQLLNATAQPPATQIADPLALTVAEYLASIDASEQHLRAIPVEAYDNISPFTLNQLSAEDRAILDALIAQDYATALAPLEEGRAFVAGADSTMTMRDYIISINPDFDFDPDTGGDTGGDTGDDTGGDTGGGTDPIVEAFENFQAQLAALLWTEVAGAFTSPVFSVDAETGAWTTTSSGGQALSGSNLSDFFETVGDAAARAIMSYIGSQQAVLDALVAQGADAARLDAATVAAEAAAKQALETLQALGDELTAGGVTNLSAIASQANAQALAVINALKGALPGLNDTLDGLVIGSRNSDPSFVVDPEGTVAGSAEGDWFYLSQLGDTFDGGAGADVLFGLNGADNLNGGADADHLFGGGGDDALSGGSENDMLAGGRGDDALDGGSGSGDVASFNGPMGRFTLQLAADGSIVVQDRSAGGDGTDTLRDIEMLSFSSGATIFEDGMLDLSIIQGITGLSETEIATFIELYIAYFNRAPDALGLYFWGSAFASGTTLEETATLFLDQDETRATYPAGATNLDFATQVYSNVLGRVPDQEGLDFWTAQLDGGFVSQATFILEVLRGAKAEPDAGATQDFVDLQLQDRAYLENKTDIGTYFAVIQGLSNVDDAAQAMQLYVRGDDSSIQSAIAEIDSDYAQAVAAGSGELILQLVGIADDPFAI